MLRVHVGEFVFIFFVLLDSDQDDIDLNDRDGEWVPPVQDLEVLALERHGDWKVRGVQYFHHWRQNSAQKLAVDREHKMTASMPWRMLR